MQESSSLQKTHPQYENNPPYNIGLGVIKQSHQSFYKIPLIISSDFFRWIMFAIQQNGIKQFKLLRETLYKTRVYCFISPATLLKKTVEI